MLGGLNRGDNHMKQKLINFFNSSWPHATIGAVLILSAIVQDDPIPMIIGMGSIMVSILNYKESI